MSEITEIAPEVFRISAFVPAANLQFNQFLVRDEEPLLFQQNGDVEPMTESDVVGRFQRMLAEYQQGPMAYYLPYANHTEPTLNRLAALKPRILATMHGATFLGDGEQAIRDLAQAMKEVLGGCAGS